MADADEPGSPPIDALICDIIAQRHIPTSGDAARIIGRMRSSTFSLARRNIPAPLQALMIEHGYEVPARGNDLIYHWAKHVLGDEQWTQQTLPDEYFQDALRAIDHPSSRLYVQAGMEGRDVAAVVARTDEIVPVERIGRRSGSELIVVYSGALDRIVSVHMTNNLSIITSRPGTVWLRS